VLKLASLRACAAASTPPRPCDEFLSLDRAGAGATGAGAGLDLFAAAAATGAAAAGGAAAGAAAAAAAPPPLGTCFACVGAVGTAAGAGAAAVAAAAATAGAGVAGLGCERVATAAAGAGEPLALASAAGGASAALPRLFGCCGLELPRLSSRTRFRVSAADSSRAARRELRFACAGSGAFLPLMFLVFYACVFFGAHTRGCTTARYVEAHGRVLKSDLVLPRGLGMNI
jgi:hypothetical protein